MANTFTFKHARERTAGIVRPSVEALLLAAVALGCAQGGWTLLAPSTAGALNTAGEENDPLRFEPLEVQSPFAPDAGPLDANSHALTALLSGIELKGVRIATDVARSGAMFSLADGADRAFLIGQEIVDGVTLAEVDAEYVLLAYDGGQRRLDMTAAPSFSFARAMMGLEPAPGAPATAESAAESAIAVTPAMAVAEVSEAPRSAEIGAAPAQFAFAESAQELSMLVSGASLFDGFAANMSAAPLAADDITPEAQAWLMATLANVEFDGGAPRGWRVAGAMPDAAESAGLQEGDLIVAVNGAGPAQGVDLLSAAAAERLELAVERGAAQVTLVIEPNGRT